MSFKYQTIKHTENHYVLPKMGNMKCDVHAFLSEKLYQASEEIMWTQAHDSASYEGVTGMYLMPDSHMGYGIPVGGVVVTDDVIIQSGSGYDISCGVIYLKVPGLTAQDVASWDKRDSWVREVGKRVAFGAGSNRPQKMPEFTYNKAVDMLHNGVKPLHVKPEFCERQFIPVNANYFKEDLVETANKHITNQLGSVGAGNHYVELQVSTTTGEIYVMIHCGSRGYGYQTANHFFYEGAKLRGLLASQRERSWLRIDEPLGKQYWAHHNAAANYAIANRHIIVESVNEALRKVFKAEGELFYEISHNLVQEETIVLPDGTTKKGFVHRKGATRAFPAGHPDLKRTKWEATGHPILIPGSMYDGAAILFPQENAYQSGCSVNHGSGRVLGRNEAKRKLKHNQQYINDEMKNVKRKLGNAEIRGIVTNSNKIPLDECRKVYKKLDDVLAVLEDENIAKVSQRLYPIANLKGA